MEVALCATVVELCSGVTKPVVSNKILRVCVKETWDDVIDRALNGINVSSEMDEAIDKGLMQVSLRLKDSTSETTFNAHFEDTVSTALDFDKNLKFVKFIVDTSTLTHSKSCEPQTETQDPNNNEGKALKILMDSSRGRKPPVLKTDGLRFTGSVLDIILHEV